MLPFTTVTAAWWNKAMRYNTNEIDWLYTATTENSRLEGDKIVVRMSDKPGNITEQEQLL